MKPSVSIMLRWSAKAVANDRVWLTHKKDLCLKANSITKSDPSIDSAYYIHIIYNDNGDGTITFGFSELVIKFGSKKISTTSNESWAWLHFVKTVASHCSYGISVKNGDSCLHYYVPLKGLSVDISQFLYICPSNGFIKAGLSNHSLTGQHLQMGSLHSHKKISKIFTGLYTFCIRLTTGSATSAVWLHLSGPSY